MRDSLYVAFAAANFLGNGTMSLVPVQSRAFQLMSVTMTLVNDATVANRRPLLTGLYGGVVLSRALTNTTAAGVTTQYSWRAGSFAILSGVPFMQAPLGDFVLPAGSLVQLSVDLGVVGDVVSAVTGFFRYVED